MIPLASLSSQNDRDGNVNTDMKTFIGVKDHVFYEIPVICAWQLVTIDFISTVHS